MKLDPRTLCRLLDDYNPIMLLPPDDYTMMYGRFMLKERESGSGYQRATLPTRSSVDSLTNVDTSSGDPAQSIPVVPRSDDPKRKLRDLQKHRSPNDPITRLHDYNPGNPLDVFLQIWSPVVNASV